MRLISFFGFIANFLLIALMHLGIRGAVGDEGGDGGDGSSGGSGGAAGGGEGGDGKSGAGQGSDGQGAQGNKPPAFSVPDAYKEKGWAKKVKSLDDVFQQIDTLDSLKGKKTVVPDFEKATPTEIEEYFKQTRPQDKKDYVFAEGSDKEFSEGVAEILYKYGTHKFIGNKILAECSALAGKIKAKQFDKASMAKTMQESFGEGFDKIAGETANLLRQHLSEADVKLLESIPNNHLGLIYRLANNFKKAYGIKESAAAGNGGGEGGAGGDKVAQRKAIRTQLDALSKRMHTAEEKQSLINQLEATYK